jgi:hypothetical protein
MNKISRCKILREKSYQLDGATDEKIESLISGISLLEREFSLGRLDFKHTQTIERLKLKLSDLGVDIADLPEYQTRMAFLGARVGGIQNRLVVV